MSAIEHELEMRRLYMPIAILEHHQMADPVLSRHDICDRLGLLWPSIRRDAEANAFTLDAASVLGVNERVARSLDLDGCVFRNEDAWASFIDELINIDDGIDGDPSHMCSWIFSALYWNHLSRCRLATAWFFTNAIRVQHAVPEYQLSLDKLGHFLGSLSGSGPPTCDGQTFYPERYSG